MYSKTFQQYSIKFFKNNLNVKPFVPVHQVASVRRIDPSATSRSGFISKPRLNVLAYLYNKISISIPALSKRASKAERAQALVICQAEGLCFHSGEYRRVVQEAKFSLHDWNAVPSNNIPLVPRPGPVIHYLL
jgi:hypothetical protein